MATYGQHGLGPCTEQLAHDFDGGGELWVRSHSHAISTVDAGTIEIHVDISADECRYPTGPPLDRP